MNYTFCLFVYALQQIQVAEDSVRFSNNSGAESIVVNELQLLLAVNAPVSAAPIYILSVFILFLIISWHIMPWGA